MTPHFFAYRMQIHRARTYQKNKNKFWTHFFLQFNIRFLASATRLQQSDFPTFVATTIGKQRSRHCLFIFIKKQKTYPFTFSSVAKKNKLMTPQFFFAYRMQIHRARTCQRVNKFSGLFFFYNSLYAINCPIFAYTFNGSFLIQPLQFNFSLCKR